MNSYFDSPIFVKDGSRIVREIATLDDAIIDTSGLVLGRVAGVSLSGGASQLDNAGTIRNLSGLSSDLAIEGNGGATAISNTNLVTGTVDLGAFGNSFTNSGIWNTANGTNSFGALTLGNSVINTGTIIASDNPAAVQTTVFAGLNTFTNAGALTMQDGLAGDRTVVSGNYVGGQGGTVLLDTYLGADGSPSDLLHIQGNTAGSSFLRVANAGGPGALTTSDGIQVVQVDGASDGLFSLVSDYEIAGQRAVVGGAYAYTLWKNGVTTPTDGDWYLRSQLSNPVIPGEPEPPVDPGEPTQPEGPLYQAGVPSYEAYPQVLQSLNGLSTLQQRLRNRYWSAAGNVVVEQGDGPGIAEATPSLDGSVSVGDRGVWGRIEGVYSRFDPKVSTSSTDYDIDTFWMQAGLDGQFYESDAGRLIGGITVHYGHATADVSSFYGNGDIDTDGYGFGGNLTWYGTNGFYIDGQAEVTWYASDLSSQLAERNLVEGNNGIGYALSLETGKRIDIDGNWTITPQAQLVYSAVEFDSFNDPFGARVSLDRDDSLSGRLGLSIDRENSWYGDNGLISRSHIYGIANLYYEFLDGSRVDVDGTKFSSRDNRVWGGVGIGGSYNWNEDKYSIYGEGAVNTSLVDFGDSYALKGAVGFRVKW
jgi:outer membrane autotransporter protein